MSAKTYTRAVHQETSLFGTWPPMSDVKLGDYYKLVRGVPKYLGNIRDEPWGISFTQVSGTNPDASTPTRTEWVSKSADGVKYEVRLDLDTPPGQVFQALGKVDLGIGITMDKESAYLLAMQGMSAVKVQNLVTLNSQLRDKWLRLFDGWDTRWLVVTAVWSATSTAAVTSDGADSGFDFSVNGEVGDLGAGDPLAKLATAFTLTGNHDGSDNFNVGDPSTPLFEACRVGFGTGPRPAFEAAGDELPSFHLISPEEDLDELEFPE